MSGRAAVFLDRDGVLNEILERDGKPASPRRLAEFRLAADVASVGRLSEAGLLVFIVTNQPDVARRRMQPEVLDAMLQQIREAAHIDDYRVCPHEDADGCGCRKPLPGMITDLAQHWHVDLDRSYLLGDPWRDVDAAVAAGCMPILIRRPYNDGATAGAVVDTLEEAVGLVLNRVEAGV
jgi:D-glycero-D-manno-heptose 1,7-bisphosphate phosphatase